VIGALCATLAVIVAAAAARPTGARTDLAASPSPSLFVLITDLLDRRRARRRPSPGAVAAWCDEVSRRVRSGSSLRQAVTVPPPDDATRDATSALRLGIERGLSISESVVRVEPRGPHLGLALDVMATTSRIGGPSAASIDRTAVLLRQRAADLDERSAHAAQARLSTHVMTAVPLVMLALLVVTDDDVRSTTTSPIGAACVVIGLALNIAGWWWMRRIIGAPL
jgi:tight adherence protein B